MVNKLLLVSSRLSELRGGDSVSAFARKVGINQQTMDTYIKGRLPPLDLCARIATIFDVSIDWLAGLSDDRGGASGRGGDAEKAEYHKKLSDLEAENISLKGEVRGLQFALESALKGAHPAQASVSHSRPA